MISQEAWTGLKKDSRSITGRLRNFLDFCINYLPSAVASWYAPSLAEDKLGPPYEIASSVIIGSLAGFLLWSDGPNPAMFGLIIGSGWFLNRLSDLFFLTPSE